VSDVGPEDELATVVAFVAVVAIVAVVAVVFEAEVELEFEPEFTPEFDPVPCVALEEDLTAGFATHWQPAQHRANIATQMFRRMAPPRIDSEVQEHICSRTLPS
jgi:hypothetical protein